MLKKIAIFSISLFSFIFAQKEIDSSIDYNRFYFSDDSTYVEFYYRINKLSLNVDSLKRKVKAKINFEIQDSSYKTIFTKNFFIENEFDSLSTGNELVGQFAAKLKTNKYSFSFKVIDEFDSNNVNQLNGIIEKVNYSANHFLLSDIQTSRKIFKSENPNSLFYKNTYEVIPNPDNLFSSNEPIIFYYLELYKLNYLQSNAKLEFSIRDNNNKVLISKFSKISPKNNSIVKVGSFNLSKLATGSYYILANLQDSTTDYSYTTYRKFYFVNLFPKVENLTVLNSIDMRFSSLSETECDVFWDKMRYLSTKKDKSIWSDLKTLEAKRNFLADFWNRNDREFSTTNNEFMNDYLRKLKYVNEKYKTQMSAGYKTDMGRIYLTYGQPDSIDRYPNNVNARPYEVWTYNSIEGGVVFIFVDMLGLDDYQLVHSTKRGELYNPNWEVQSKRY